jgi:deazaflavin-dependent oxidoreductase (nitroreductase family)
MSMVNDVRFKILNAVHRFVLRASGGRLGRHAFGLPVVELHTVGRRTGKVRSTMLISIVTEPDRVVFVASKGGDDRDPDWYQNAMAHPEVEITLDGRRRKMRARTATPEERSQLWPRAVAAHRGYAAYQRRSSREIPLLICEATGD